MFAFFESFSGSKRTGDIFRTMEKIGDKESAIAERVRALLAAANSTAAAVVTPSTSSGASPVPIPRDPRRLDPGADPARVVANLTAAGIQLAVSKKNLCIFIVISGLNLEISPDYLERKVPQTKTLLGAPGSSPDLLF